MTSTSRPCFEIEVASHGDTVEGALANLREAVELRLRVRGEPETHPGPSPMIWART